MHYALIKFIGGLKMSMEILNNVDTVETSVSDITGNTEEYLAFISDGLSYVVSVSNIVEIIMNHTITHLPKVPHFIRGIINLRGQVIPIIDVRLRMNRPQSELSDEEVCVIVINVNDVLMGLLVEKVSHIVNLMPEHITPPPTNKHQELVSGIVNIDGSVYLLLDCERLLQ